MQKSQKERTKDNLEAQISKLKLQVQRAVANAHEAVEIKEGYLLEVQNLGEELEEKRSDLDQVVSAIKDREKQIEVLETTYQDITDEIADKINTFEIAKKEMIGEEKKIAARIDKIQRQEQGYEDQITQRQEEFNIRKRFVDEEIQRLDQKITSRKKHVDDLDAKISDRFSEYNTVLDDFVSMQQDIESFDVKMKARENELDIISEEHNQRKAVLDQREEDIEVISRRLKKLYEQHFPGRKLEI